MLVVEVEVQRRRLSVLLQAKAGHNTNGSSQRLPVEYQMVQLAARTNSPERGVERVV